MTELRDLARQLLADRTVAVVIGYEEGPRGVRPAFVTDPAGADRLVFDARCVHNLAVYLSPKRAHVVRLGRPAVVVKGCDARAVAGLLRENQIRRREDVVLIGVRCGGVLGDPASAAALGPDTVAARCAGCTVREPGLADHRVGVLPPAPPAPAIATAARVAAIDAMTPAERWAFWQEELERCVRCHACREVCPLCYCERCIADKGQPQWIESSPHPRGSFAWHAIRALHLAGRCVGCDECERACPVDIPLGLLNRKVAEVVAERFDHRASDDPAVPAPIGAFRTDDSQEFIR
jgi:ferredoxin